MCRGIPGNPWVFLCVHIFGCVPVGGSGGVIGMLEVLCVIMCCISLLVDGTVGILDEDCSMC